MSFGDKNQKVKKEVDKILFSQTNSSMVWNFLGSIFLNYTPETNSQIYSSFYIPQIYFGK